MTVRDLIKDALMEIGAIASGETPTSAEEADALSILNRMIRSWSTNNLLIPPRTIETFTLIPSQGTYTFGNGGDFNSAKPAFVEVIKIKINGIEYDVDIVSLQEWADITSKSQQSSMPSKAYIEDTYPMATVHLYPVPDTANQIVFYTKKPLSQFANASETISLQDGYEDALMYNLAVRLARPFQVQAGPETMMEAKNSLANIQRKNIKPTPMKSDVTGSKVWDRYAIYKGGS